MNHTLPLLKACFYHAISGGTSPGAIQNFDKLHRNLLYDFDMAIADSFTKLWTSRWFPCTVAVTICFGAFILFERSYEPLLTRARSSGNDRNDTLSEQDDDGDVPPAIAEFMEAQGFERVSPESIAEEFSDRNDEDDAQRAIDELIEAEAAYRDLWSEIAERESVQTFTDAGPDDEETNEQPIVGTAVPSLSYPQSPPNPREFNNTQPTERFASPHRSTISFAPSPTRPTYDSASKDELSTAADVITTALSKGSSITINPPSATAQLSDFSPNSFPRTPFPFGSPHPSITPSFWGWTKADQAPIGPEHDSYSEGASPKMEQKSSPQMPTIAEETGAGVGLGISGALGDDEGESRQTPRKKRRHSRKGLGQGAMVAQ